MIQFGGNMNQKIKTREELAGIVANLKNSGKKIVHTNGSYDILHVGHVRTLQGARSLGDVLIVSINSDSSIKGFKGPDRPIVAEDERAEMLSALSCVDYVCVFPENDILKTLSIIKPDFQVKGGSFIEERVRAEKELVESWGGSFVGLPIVDGKSTTNIIDKVLKVYK